MNIQNENGQQPDGSSETPDEISSKQEKTNRFTSAEKTSNVFGKLQFQVSKLKEKIHEIISEL